MKETGYGDGYLYPHDAPDRAVAQNYLPPELGSVAYYEPGPFGFEKDMKKRMDWWAKVRREAMERERVEGGEPGREEKPPSARQPPGGSG
jgi:putative ATPase